MAIKRGSREEEEFQELVEILREDWEELTNDSDSEDELLVFWTDRGGETHFRCSDGDHGSMPFAEFIEIRNQVGRTCLVCVGSLELIFDLDSRPILCLACEKCRAVHRVVSGELCLSATC